MDQFESDRQVWKMWAVMLFLGMIGWMCLLGGCLAVLHR